MDELSDATAITGGLVLKCINVLRQVKICLDSTLQKIMLPRIRMYEQMDTQARNDKTSAAILSGADI